MEDKRKQERENKRLATVNGLSIIYGPKTKTNPIWVYICNKILSLIERTGVQVNSEQIKPFYAICNELYISKKLLMSWGM